jgi:hypothetical protein
MTTRKETTTTPRATPKTILLPDSPRTGSRVPWLTSIHATLGRGRYGDASYRGNCSGLLIRDLLDFYRPGRVLDPMEGSGTCKDVCRELGIPYRGADLRTGFDATNAANFAQLGRFDFVWLHPPYAGMVRYNPGDARCLSSAASPDEFLEKLRRVLANCRAVLTPRGKLAVLIGDLRAGGRYLGLPFHTFHVAAACSLRLAAPEIIRFQHGATSSRREYKEAFIPRLHDVCLVFEPDELAPPR